jgi:prephenate dehydratase
MADTVSTVIYHTITIANKAGEGAKVLGALKDAGIDLAGLWGYPLKGKKAALDIVPADAKAFLKAAKKLKLEVSPKKSSFFVTGEDRPGALAENLARLAAAGVNVHAVQCGRAAAGLFGAFIQVAADDLKKAKKALGA